MPKLVIDPHTGLPAKITVEQIGDADILVAPVTFQLREDGKEVPGPTVNRLSRDAYTITLPDRDLKMELRYGTAGLPYLEWVVERGYRKTGNLSATFRLPLRPSMDRAFFPAADNPRVTLAQDGLPTRYSYGVGPGTKTVMPMGQVYSAEEDRGLAFFGEFGAHIEDLSTSISRTEKNTLVTITFSLPRSGPGKSSRRLYFAATKGDWRPALGVVLSRFPEAFEPHDPGIARLNGVFAMSVGIPSDSDITDWRAQGVRVVEIHGTFPFYGEYVAKDKVWTPLIDDKWHSLKAGVPVNQRPGGTASWQEIKKLVEKRHPPNMTVTRVNDYIDRLHTQGIKGLIYFNPTEAWAPWAAAQFARDRILTATGKVTPRWYESVVMYPDKQRPWGQYLLQQIRSQLRIYPQVDGVFFDMAVEGGHDLTDLCAEACRLVRAQGKICWWNGPYNMELASLADGLMTEGGGTEAYRQETAIVQYYGMAGKPIASLAEPRASGYAALLLHGVIPKPVNRSQGEMGERWFPLFSWLHNRRWVLEAHALDTTSGVKADIFRNPDGNLVVPVVPDFPQTVPAKPLFDIDVTVRVSDAAGVHAVYLLAPDLRGYHKLPFVREENELRITIPRLGVAGLLVLAKTGIFPALEGGLSLVRGQDGTLRWGVDNWTRESKQVLLTMNGPLAQKHVSGRVEAGSTMALEMPVKVPASGSESTMEIDTSAKVEGEEKAGKAELWLDPPLLMSVEGPSTVYDDKVYTLVARVLGHLSAGAKINLKADTSEWQLEESSKSVVLRPDGYAIVEFKGRPLKSGETRIKFTATDGGQVSADAEISAEAIATAVAPGALDKVRSASLLLDVFGVDGGDYAHKPVFLNGVQLGDLPQGKGDQWTSKVMVLPPAAIKALREHNEITIDNRVRDAFKVRNFQLLLRTQGGGTAVSATDNSVYTAGAGWLHAEGKQFILGQPLTGITVDIRVDTKRTEKYESFIGVPKAARLTLEINGSDGGIYAHKVVSLNNQPIGELPASGDWTRKSMAITAKALESLDDVNEVKIENSDPPDAFKVRRASLEVENVDGRKFVSETEKKVYTSMDWDFAEGEVGSPIRFTLRFRRPIPERSR